MGNIGHLRHTNGKEIEKPNIWIKRALNNSAVPLKRIEDHSSLTHGHILDLLTILKTRSSGEDGHVLASLLGDLGVERGLYNLWQHVRGRLKHSMKRGAESVPATIRVSAKKLSDADANYSRKVTDGEDASQKNAPFIAHTPLTFFLQDSTNAKHLPQQVLCDFCDAQESWRTNVISNHMTWPLLLKIYRSALLVGQNRTGSLLLANKKEQKTIHADVRKIIGRLEVLVEESGHEADGQIKKLLSGKQKQWTPLSQTQEVLALAGARIPVRQQILDMQASMQALLREMQEISETLNIGRNLTLQALARERRVWPKNLRDTLDVSQGFDDTRGDLGNQIARANLRLVVHIAKKFRGCGEFSNLLLAGAHGMNEALDRYNKRYLKNKFGTYAGWWIRRTIQAARQIGPFALSRVDFDNMKSLTNIESERQAEGMSPMDIDQLALQLKMPRESLALFLQACCVTGIEGIDEHGETFQVIPDPVHDEENPFSLLRGEEQRDDVIIALRSLPQLQRNVLILRFGLRLRELPKRDGDPRVRFVTDLTMPEAMTLKNVKNILGGTLEHIRQVQDEATLKLRNNKHPFREVLTVHDQDDHPENISSTGLNGIAAPKKRPEFEEMITMWEVFDWCDPAERNEGTKVFNTLEQHGVFTVQQWQALSTPDKLLFYRFTHKRIAIVDSLVNKIRLGDFQEGTTAVSTSTENPS